MLKTYFKKMEIDMRVNHLSHFIRKLLLRASRIDTVT